MREYWQLWPIVGGVGNGVAEEDWPWDLNSGVAALRRLFGTTLLWCLFGDHAAAWAEKKQGLLFLFLQYSTLDWAEGEGRIACLWVF